MERQELKLIGSKIVEGSFAELLEVLNKKSECLTQKQALYLIVCCCNTCNSHMANCDKLNEKRLIAAVKGLSKFVTKVTDEEYDSYLQSIFFMCKLLMKKKYEFILEIDNEILPEFIPKILTEKQKGVYKSICNLIQNGIVNLATDRAKVDPERIISMGHFLSKIIIMSANYPIYIEYVSKYAFCFPRLNVDLTMQYEFLMHCMPKMKVLPSDVMMNGILQFLKFGFHLFTSNITKGNLQCSDQCIREMLSVVPRDGEWIDLLGVVNICKYIIDPESDKNNFIISKDILVKSVKLYRKSENFHVICKFLSQVMVSYSNFCQNNQNINADPDKHIIIYEILGVLMEFFASKSECTKVCICSSKSNSEVSDTASCIMILFSKLMVNNDIGKDYIKKVRGYIKKYLEILVSQKNKKCERYKTWWSDSAAYLHNVGVSLFRKENYEETLSFGNMTLEYLSLLDIHDEVVLPSIFNLISSIYLKQKMYKEALIWTALETINTKQSSRDKGIIKWVKIKSAGKEESSSELQEYTIVSISKEIPKDYSHYINRLQEKEAQIDLLVSELEMYRMRWKSKIPMMSTFRHLCEIGDKQTIMKTFVKVFTGEEIRVHHDVLKLVRDIFTELENSGKKDQTSMLYLFFYFFFLYNHETLNMIAKNWEEMDRMSKLTKKPDPIEDMIPADALDRCDVVSVYENLKVNGVKLKNLEKSLDALETIISMKLSPGCFQEVEPKQVYELTRNIAIEFILHSDSYNTMRSLLLAFTLAEYIDDQYFLLECSGYFLKYLNFSDLELKMEMIICNLKNHKQSNKYLIEYYINLSHFYLADKNIEIANQHYNNAKKYYRSLIEEKEKIEWYLEVSMELLLFKLLNLAKSLKFEMEMKFTHGPLIKAYNVIIDRYATVPHWNTHAMLIMIEIFDTLIQMYLDLRLPREVRCFGKQLLTITQQHVVPVYSAKLLSYLAYADLWCERFDDCRVKLDGISDILVLDKMERCSKPMKPKSQLTIPSVDDIMEGINEIMLDVPSKSVYNFKSSPTSPAVQGQAYRSPFFINHALCKCFHCTSLQCQQTVLSCYHLEALWYMHKKQITLSDSFFKGLFKLLEALSVKRKDIGKVFHQYVSDYSKHFKVLPKKDNETISSFDEIKMYASVSYVKFLASSGAQEAAEKFLDIALKNFETAKIYQPNLYGQMLLQKIGLIYKMPDNKNICAMQQDTNDESDVKTKTPEACVAKNLFPKIKSPKQKKFLQPKIIKFNLADSESSATPSKNVEKSTVVRTPRPKLIPPSLRNISTPNVKTPSRTNCSIFPSENCQNTPQIDEKRNPSSKLSEASAQLSQQERKNLKEKTKLLTSRLRKKNNSENDSADTKNLEDKDSQPVRRSSRKRT